MLDVLALSSTYYADYLARFGINAIVVPRGYSSLYGSIRNTNRDIAAVWMGKIRTKRRSNAIYWIYNYTTTTGTMCKLFTTFFIEYNRILIRI